MGKTGWEEVLDAARQLEELLKKERSLLQARKIEKLWPLLAEKEALGKRLHHALVKLKKENDLMHQDCQQARSSLKTMLHEIQQLNRSNGIFIQGFLSHTKDFIGFFIPQGYNRQNDEGLETPPSTKGLMLSKEA